MVTQQGTLLIVEDLLLMRQIIKGFLRRMGYARILEAEQGVEALTCLRQQPIDLVLADWDLPQMDGLWPPSRRGPMGISSNPSPERPLRPK